jgi:hypothetical protein
MKLYKILFENDDDSTRPASLAKPKPTPVKKSASEEKLIDVFLPMIVNNESWTGSIFQQSVKDVGPFKVAEEFIEQNQEMLKRIIGSKTIKYLGSGAVGDAFDLGDMILKIEIEHGREKVSSAVRAFKSAKALWSKDKKLGACMPMIYDQGILKYKDKNINWILMEKFKPISEDDKAFVNTIIDEIISSIFTGAVVTSDHKKRVKELGEHLQLSDGWYKQLKACMKALAAINIKDFHAGNIGVRSTTGTLVFFD